MLLHILLLKCLSVFNDYHLLKHNSLPHVPLMHGVSMRFAAVVVVVVLLLNQVVSAAAVGNRTSDESRGTVP